METETTTNEVVVTTDETSTPSSETVVTKARAYPLTCKVTGNTVSSNPPQIAALCARFGLVNKDELDTQYVSREGRNVIKSLGLTIEQASEKYGVKPEILANFKCWPKPVKEKKPRAPRKAKVEEVAATSTEEVPVTETPVDVVTPSVEEDVTIVEVTDVADV